MSTNGIDVSDMLFDDPIEDPKVETPTETTDPNPQDPETGGNPDTPPTNPTDPGGSLDFLNKPDEPTEGGEQPLQGNDEASRMNEVASNYYKILTEEGLLALPEDFEFQGTLDSLKKAQELHRTALEQATARQLLASMPEELQGVINYGMQGGKDIKQYLELVSEVQDYTNLDISTEMGQEAVLRQAYKENGLEDAQINLLIENAKTQKTLEKFASDVKQQFVARNQSRLEAQQQKMLLEKKQREDMETALETSVINNLKSLKWKAARKQAIYNELYKKDETGAAAFDKRLESIKSNPEALVQLADFITYYDSVKKEFNLDEYKKLNSKATTQLRSSWESAMVQDTQRSTTNGGQGGGVQEIDFTTGDIDIF